MVLRQRRRCNLIGNGCLLNIGVIAGLKSCSRVNSCVPNTLLRSFSAPTTAFAELSSVPLQPILLFHVRSLAQNSKDHTTKKINSWCSILMRGWSAFIYINVCVHTQSNSAKIQLAIVCRCRCGVERTRT